MTICIIPARGGSKGVKRKNMKSIMGKPLLYWSILRAQQSDQFSTIYVSTEDSEIEAFSKQNGCLTLSRTSLLASDEAKTIDVINHHWRELNEPKCIVTLQPTSPCRSKGLIDRALSEYKYEGPGILATGFMSKQTEFGSNNNMRRQDLDGFFYDDGNVYIHSDKAIRQMLWSSKEATKFLTSDFENFEIDTELDFLVLETLMKQYFVV
jgi:CMP-N,N'-diacetyllegionaminic acid synthase